MFKSVAQLAVVAALSFGAVSAQAVTLNLTGYANGSVAASGSSPAFSANAGGFVGNLSGAPGYDANPFYTYCVELTESFGFGSLSGYTVTGGASYFASVLPSLPAASAVATRLGKLFTSLGGVNLPSSATQSAAIQLAVWESIYEGTAAGTLSVGTGLFQASSTSAVVTAANTILANAALVTTSLYSVAVLTKAGSQDFLLISRIPEPGSLALAGLALAGLALARRRRTN